MVYRTADIAHAEGSRYLGANIPGAKTVELPGNVYFPYLGDQDAVLDEIEEFLTGVRPPPVHDRVLATVLFTDIVGSTHTAAQVGDHRGASCSKRVSSLAGSGEVFASRTVVDLVAGFGLTFTDHGVHHLKGVPEPWHIYRAT